MVVSEDFIKELYTGGDIPLKGPLLTPLPPRPYNLIKPITSLSNINSKIKKMRCNVCQSQSSIDKVMGRNQKVCDMCETVPVDPFKLNKFKRGIGSRELKPKPANNAPTQIWIDYLKSKGKTNDDPQIKALQRQKNANIAALSYASGSTNLKFPRPSGKKPGELGNNFLKSINTNLLGKNTESAFNTPGSLNLEAMANARAAAKNNGLGNNPLDSVNTNLLGKNTENIFNMPGSLNLEAMAKKAAMKKRLIAVENQKNKKFWIDPKTQVVYRNENGKSHLEHSLGRNDERYWIQDNSKKVKLIKENKYKELNEAINGSEVQNNTLPNGWKKYTRRNNTWYVDPNGKSQWERPTTTASTKTRKNKENDINSEIAKMPDITKKYNIGLKIKEEEGKETAKDPRFNSERLDIYRNRKAKLNGASTRKNRKNRRSTRRSTRTSRR
jgi:hypothetical protein